ncbi:hypothetical protein FNV43_RR20731 [Rhamnella rubrinervis]|uniref:Uncharacterized protein n=1 Tax=Rhamnella rubrinervis TaxID=2594499 RepID=A0A8K0DVD4_9ROSA|nr:hypothetical protein FNV43_RR20731 [Rhamnella rubrinervis]
MASSSVSKALKYPAATDAHVRITNKAALGKVLDDVKKKMSTLVDNAQDITPEYFVGQRRKMEENCFGQLFLQFNVKFSAAIVHHLLRSQVYTSDKTYLKFNSGGSTTQFRKNEIRDEYFSRADVITNAMVKDVYSTTKQWIEDDDIVKLSLLYILECGLLGKESHAEVKMDHVRMALEKPNPSGTYNLGGCPIAFQIWGYKPIPKLGKLTAHKSDDVVFPPICKWYTTSSINYQTLKNKVFSEEGYDVVATLEASTVEENMLSTSDGVHDE